MSGYLAVGGPDPPDALVPVRESDTRSRLCRRGTDDFQGEQTHAPWTHSPVNLEKPCFLHGQASVGDDAVSRPHEAAAAEMSSRDEKARRGKAHLRQTYMLKTLEQGQHASKSVVSSNCVYRGATKLTSHQASVVLQCSLVQQQPDSCGLAHLACPVSHCL
jgi:hypothetical protein